MWLVPNDMRRLAWWLLVVAICSCGGSLKVASSSPSAPSVSASPTAAASPSAATASPSTVLAVVYGPGNTLSLAASDGSVRASTTVDPPPLRANSFVSWTSASLSRLYYLNAGSEVRFLQPDGTSGSVTRITLAPGEQAGFAVSPDDKKIAVSIWSFTLPATNTQAPASPIFKGMRMYVEDLQGGGHHVDIFASTTVAEFPVGWTSGHLVIAASSPLCCQTLPLNPYAATAYHVVSPDNADRLASLCDNSSGPSGPVEPIGAMCLEYQGGPSFRRWDGSPFPPPSAVQTSYEYLNALSPDGTWSAEGGTPVQLMHLGTDDRLGVSGYVFGWLDADHLVIQKQGSSTLSVLETADQTVTDLPGGTYLGTFPAAIS